jgi:molecular chaperone GrpE
VESRKDFKKEDLEVQAGVERAREPGPEAAAPASDPKALAEQVLKLQAEKQELLDTLVRRQADFENYRKRIEKERQHEQHRGVESLIENLLPVLDAFERAIAAHQDPAYEEYQKGVELIERRLRDALAKQGLERIEARGQSFDPHFHHAIERVETDQYPDGSVIEVLQSGYTLHGKVLRPAMVRVAIHPVLKTHETN